MRYSLSVLVSSPFTTEESLFVSRQGQESFLYSTVIRPDLGPTEPHPMGAGSSFLDGKAAEA
jgi:hypothetical protein